jgi:ABC-type amino acid transport substrate-binding protein
MQRLSLLTVLIFVLYVLPVAAAPRDLDAIKAAGVIRHLGIPYANFVTGQGDGLSVDMIRLFARYLGVEYQFVQTDWKNVINDLVGQQVSAAGDKVKISGSAPVRGDLIANGLTILPWRQQVVAYSTPTFPTQVWLVTNAKSKLQPITPHEVAADIAATKQFLLGHKLLGMQNTCLDPAVYPLPDESFTTVYFKGNLNDMFPAVMQGEADLVLQDVPDALVAINLWPEQVKVLGPISSQQQMAVGFRQDSPQLLQAFNQFFSELKQSGVYTALVQKYYSDVFAYYPDFFNLNN